MDEMFGRYQVVEQVAQGSTGPVFRARHTELDREAAIKQLSPELLGVPGQRERMRREAEVLGALDDPHVVQIYDYVEEPERVWIAEQWVTGAALRAILARHGRLTPEQSVGVVRGALLGLAHAHDRGIVHRDIATGNVLADMEGTSMLVDFGLAAPIGDSAACGTPAYISPEAARGEPATKASDVYSAAAVLFELLTGSPPFPATDVATVLRQHVEEPAPPLLDHGADLQSLMRRSLDKDPAARPHDAAAFLSDLEAAAERRFGAGWLERASIAGIVAGIAGVAGAAAVGAGGGAVAGVAAPTVVIDSAAIATGAGTAGKAAGKGLKWPLLAGAAAVVVIGAAGAAVVISGNDDGDADSSAAVAPTTAPTTPAETTDEEPTIEDLQPTETYRLVHKIVSSDFPEDKIGSTTTRVWTFKPDDCGAKKCAGDIKSSSGSSFTYVWNGDTLVLGPIDPYVYEGRCVDDVTGEKVPGSHYKATRTYQNTPLSVTRTAPDGTPVAFRGTQRVKEVTSELSDGCKDSDGVNHATIDVTLTAKRG